MSELKPILDQLVGAAALQLVDASPDLITIAPVDGPPVYVNPAARRALGIGPAEDIETLLDFRPSGYARYLREVILPAAERHGSWTGETDYVTRTGEVIHVSQVTVCHDVGQSAYVSSVSRDIGPRKKIEDALRRTEERTRFALEAAHAGVWEADLKTGRVTWSESMRTVQGFSGEEFAGTFESFLALVHPADRERVDSAMADARRQRGDFSLEFRTLWPDGTSHWTVSHGRVLADADGRPARMLAMAQDVTERRQLEEQLQEAKKIEAIGQLAGGLAHDFNNLLTVILGYSRILEEDLPEDDLTRPDIVEIRRAGERAAELTRQLLAFSRRQVLQPVILDLNTLIRSMERMLARLLGENCTLELELSVDDAVIEADSSQLEQVFVNLVVNARDAMPRGGRLTISTTVVKDPLPAEPGRSAVAPGPGVQLTVTDTGIGMDAATRQRIFEPFFTTKERGRGTGLGLATVFGIVKQSGGSIAVESAPGQGSSFRLTFPSPASTAVSPQAAVRASGRGAETILVVEDEDSVRALIQSVLRRAGYQVIAAALPSEAIAAAAGPRHFDLVLTDVVMPQMGGPELLAAILAHRPNTRAVFMSGFSAEAVAGHGVLEFGVPLLQKPFAAVDLLSMVRLAFDGDLHR